MVRPFGVKTSKKLKTGLKLGVATFDILCETEGVGIPSVDLFSSCLNKLSQYMSLYPDSAPCYIDAFSNEGSGYVYIFLIGRVLAKIKQDRTKKVLLIVPNWSKRPRYPGLRKMEPITPTIAMTTLIHPRKPRERHPLQDRLKLMACILSG